MSAKHELVRALQASGLAPETSRDLDTLIRERIQRCPEGRALYTVWRVPGHGLWVAGKVDGTRSDAQTGRTRTRMLVAYPLGRVEGHEAPFKCRCHPTRRVVIER